MTKRSKTIDQDVGADKFLATLKSLESGPGIETGILEGAGIHKSDDPNDKPVTVAQIAFWQEYGTKRIPKRPWMRYSVLVSELPMKILVNKIFDGILLGKLTIDQGLSLMGEKAVSIQKEVITKWDSPPNAPSTIAAKARKGGRKKMAKAYKKDTGLHGPGRTEQLQAGYNNPLIDTSQMRNSVTYKKFNDG